MTVHSPEDILHKIWISPEKQDLEKPALEKGSQLPIVTKEKKCH
ncbi:MAG: hypothetical protein VSS75_020700 [Candidatus Parabeggiatoa sp.]|nr:hypothetical protein [Candidatus Parabeggiatoa sp.]